MLSPSNSLNTFTVRRVRFVFVPLEFLAFGSVLLTLQGAKITKNFISEKVACHSLTKITWVFSLTADSTDS